MQPTNHQPEFSHRSDRRRFFHTLAGAGAAVALPAFVPAKALGKETGTPAASERITMGAVGVGNRGWPDLRGFLGKGVQALAVCDVNQKYLKRAKVTVDTHHGNKDCLATVDYREITTRDDIDFVQVATPDHWHANIAIDACRHGKDVFCEKPLSLTVRQGRAMVEAARKYERVFSGGSQRVLGDHGKLARYVHDGSLGKISEVWVNVGSSSRYYELPGQPVPDWLDWDRWQGPAAWREFHPLRIDDRQGWENMRLYSGGQMTNWGARHFGGALYALGLDHTGPTEIHPAGEDYEHLTYLFASGIRMYKAKGPSGKPLTYRGELGTAPGEEQPPAADPKPMRLYSGSGGLMGDFLHCMRTRERPFRDVEYAHRTATVCHLGNIATWLGRSIRWDPDREEVPGDEEASQLLDRPSRKPWNL